MYAIIVWPLTSTTLCRNWNISATFAFFIVVATTDNESKNCNLLLCIQINILLYTYCKFEGIIYMCTYYTLPRNTIRQFQCITVRSGKFSLAVLSSSSTIPNPWILIRLKKDKMKSSCAAMENLALVLTKSSKFVDPIVCMCTCTVLYTHARTQLKDTVKVIVLDVNKGDFLVD